MKLDRYGLICGYVRRSVSRFVELLCRQSRGAKVAEFILFWGLAYMTTNHFPLRPPSLLPFLPYESAIPFLGWTFLVYLSVFPQAVSVAWLLDRETLDKAAAAGYGVVGIHALLFAGFPTTFSRPLDPPFNSTPLGELYRAFCVADSPGNCFPSLHVSLSILLSLALWRCRPGLGVVYLCWSFVIILSTLTTKQHYALDAVGGTLIAFAAYTLAFRPGNRTVSASLR